MTQRRCVKVCLQDYEFEGFFWAFPASDFICEHCSCMLLSSCQVPDWIYETSQSVNSEEKDKIDKQAGKLVKKLKRGMQRSVPVTIIYIL